MAGVGLRIEDLAAVPERLERAGGADPGAHAAGRFRPRQRAHEGRRVGANLLLRPHERAEVDEAVREFVRHAAPAHGAFLARFGAARHDRLVERELGAVRRVEARLAFVVERPDDEPAIDVAERADTARAALEVSSAHARKRGEHGCVRADGRRELFVSRRREQCFLDVLRRRAVPARPDAANGRVRLGSAGRTELGDARHEVGVKRCRSGSGGLGDGEEPEAERGETELHGRSVLVPPGGLRANRKGRAATRSKQRPDGRHPVPRARITDARRSWPPRAGAERCGWGGLAGVRQARRALGAMRALSARGRSVTSVPRFRNTTR